MLSDVNLTPVSISADLVIDINDNFSAPVAILSFLRFAKTKEMR